MDPIALLTRMVEIPSLSGEESALADFLVDAMRGLGFHAQVDEVGNAVGILGDGPIEIVLLGHMDTVPGAIPVRIADGKLYGRGSVDAKGPLAAFIAAAAEVGPLAGRRFVVVGATEEEAASSKGARHLGRARTPGRIHPGSPTRTGSRSAGAGGISIGSGAGGSTLASSSCARACTASSSACCAALSRLRSQAISSLSAAICRPASSRAASRILARSSAILVNRSRRSRATLRDSAWAVSASRRAASIASRCQWM